MPARTWSCFFAGFSGCLSRLGHVAFRCEDASPPWSLCGDGGICAAKILRKHATGGVKILRLSPRLSPDFSSQTRSITACWRGRLCLAPACDWPDLGGAVESVEPAGRVEGSAWVIRSGLCHALRWFALWQSAESLYRSTAFKQASEVYRVEG
jgi:hypothetical protein